MNEEILKSCLSLSCYPQVPVAKTLAVLVAPLFALGFSIGEFPGIFYR